MNTKILIKYSSLIALFLLALGLSNCADEEVEPPQVTAGFTYTIEDDQGTVRFLNTSENAEAYQWDFGDGSTSNETEPIKQFESGTYTVSLTASLEGSRSDTFTDQLVIVVISNPTMPITFDEQNTDYGATAFGGTAFEVVENPDQSGTNEKAGNVGAITNSGAAFEGIFFDLEEPLDLSANQGIKMNFWADSPVDVLIKLEQGSGPDAEVAASHSGSGWDTLRFNFSSTAQFSRFTMFVDGPGTTAGTFYLDDIEQVEALSIPVAPTDGAPAPTQDATNVISIYSDAYTNVPNQGFANYGEAIFEEVDFSGNSVLRYSEGSNLFQVIELGGDNQIDAAAAGMTNFRFDVWFPNEVATNTEFLLKLVDIPASGATEAEMRVNASSTPAAAQGQWLSFDFELAGLLANTSLGGTSNIQQVVIDLVNSGEVYLDNIYFYGTGGGGGGGDPFDSGLLTNGDFENGVSPWLEGVDNTIPEARLTTAAGNTYYSVEVTSPTPGAPFNLNLSQKLALTQGATYTLSFDAWSDRSRSIVAGIGRSGGDFANKTEVVNITDTRTTYTVTLTADAFGEADNRVLFDLNEEAGVVNLDNVKLVEDGSGGGGGSEVDEFCETPLTHFGGDPASEVIVSIFNLDAQTMRIEVASANDDPVDALVLPAGDWNPVPGISVAANDDDGDGKWVAEFFFPAGAPETVDLYFLWSKASTGGNWQSHDFGAGETATVAFDAACTPGGGGGGGGPFDSGLLTNGDFENGAAPWIVGVDDNAPAPIVTVDGNTYYSSGDINSPDPNQPFLVNLSQKLALTQGTSYTLTFDAWSDRSRDIIAGIGRSGGDFANNSQTVSITDTRATYTVTLTADNFGEADNRVLFDLNGAAGVVNIDNVKLVADSGGGGGGGGGGASAQEIAVNGDFEANNGDGSGWMFFPNAGGTAEIDAAVNNGGSYSAKIATNGASNPGIKQERIGGGVVVGGDVVQVSFDHIGAVGGEGGVFSVILFGEGNGGVSFTHVFSPAPTLGETWSTYTATFTIPGGADVTEGVSLLIETVCGGAAGCTVSANVDNVSVIVNP